MTTFLSLYLAAGALIGLVMLAVGGPEPGEACRRPTGNPSRSAPFSGSRSRVPGLFPAIAWLVMGPSRMVLTVKPEFGFLLVIVETAGRPAQRLWHRVNLGLTRRTLSSDEWSMAGPVGLNPVEVPGPDTPPR